MSKIQFLIFCAYRNEVKGRSRVVPVPFANTFHAVLFLEQGHVLSLSAFTWEPALRRCMQRLYVRILCANAFMNALERLLFAQPKKQPLLSCDRVLVDHSALHHESHILQSPHIL